MSTSITPTLEIPWGEPRELIAGTTWLWNTRLFQYASALWTLTYNIRGASAIDLTATADTQGITYQTVATATQTKDLVAGSYTWVATVTNAASPPTGEVYRVGQGDVQLLPNYATALEGDLQPNAELMLAAVEAEIAARLGQVAKSNGGPASAATSPGSAHNEIEQFSRRLSKIPLLGKEGLYTLRNLYKNEVARLNYGGTLPSEVVVFGNARGGPWFGL